MIIYQLCLFYINIVIVSTFSYKNVDSCFLNCSKIKINKRALQPSHEKSPEEKWSYFFLEKRAIFHEESLIELLQYITDDYLSACDPVILYDNLNESSQMLAINKLIENFNYPIFHGSIDENFALENRNILENDVKCTSYIVFISDIIMVDKILTKQKFNRVVVVTISSQWRIYEYLSNRISHKLMNLIVIARSEKAGVNKKDLPFILYTHELYIDAIASSKHKVLTSWKNSHFTRPNINLFPRKKITGFAGHRFLVSLAHQPPFVIKRGFDSNDNAIWDGLEVNILKILSQQYNFSVELNEPLDAKYLGPIDAVVKTVKKNQASFGLAGVYPSNEFLDEVEISTNTYSDGASFITLASTALPKYRAILGPFRWEVWICITFIYLLAIFPLTFSDQHTLKPLLNNPEEVENMFWYVFGTFTNAFSFSGKKSWSKAEMISTKVFIGFYWVFTIIISACYTGSIIAFVTLPVYPATIDDINQVASGYFQLGSLDKDGWETRFTNLSDPKLEKLFKKIDLVPEIEDGIRNTTKAFFWPYAFLGSKTQLDFLLKTKYGSVGKRSVLHLSKGNVVSNGVSIIFPKNSEFETIINEGIGRIVQSGLNLKIKSDVEWNSMKSASGKFLAVNRDSKEEIYTTEDRALTLDDTQGMFLLLSFGYALGGFCFFSEFVGGCINFVKAKFGILTSRPGSNESLISNPRMHPRQTFRKRIDDLESESNENDLRALSSKTFTRNSSFVLDGNLETSKDTDNMDQTIDEIFQEIDEVFGEKNVDNSHKSVNFN